MTSMASERDMSRFERTPLDVAPGEIIGE